MPESTPPIATPPVVRAPDGKPEPEQDDNQIDNARINALVQRIAVALEGVEARFPPKRTGHWVWRAIGNALKTEWKYLLVGLMILVGHYRYHLSLLYYAHELADTQQEHIALDDQRRANAKIVQHHIDLADALFGEGEMREAENEYRLALKLDPSNLDSQRGLFKASIFDEVDDDTNQRSASPVVILSRIRELACEVQESSCGILAGKEEDDDTRQARLRACESTHLACLRQREGEIPAAGDEGAHVKLLEGMALANVDPEGSVKALRTAITLADGPSAGQAATTGAPTKLAAAYIRLGDYYLGQEGAGALNSAVAHYQVALRVAPWNINALDSLGYALHRSGQLEQARDRFERLTLLDDTLMVAHADLGRTLRCLAIRRAGDPAALGAAYDEQHHLLSLLTKTPPPVTRDSTSQWLYPVEGRTFDLHELPLKVAYATCSMGLTAHLRGMPQQIAACRRALTSGALTSYQRQTTRDFLLVEVSELSRVLSPGTSPQITKRIAEFRNALHKTP
jgi:tetratricopeptide (TPR) repeat protein